MKDNYPTLTQSQQREAPWNQVELPPTTVDCCVSYCMSKSMLVTVENYGAPIVLDDAFGNKEDIPEYNFENTNFINEFENDGNAIGIPTLLAELQNLCMEKIERLRDEIDLTYTPEGKKKVRREMAHCLSILNASRDWIVDDMDVIKEG